MSENDGTLSAASARTGLPLSEVTGSVRGAGHRLILTVDSTPQLLVDVPFDGRTLPGGEAVLVLWKTTGTKILVELVGLPTGEFPKGLTPIFSKVAQFRVYHSQCKLCHCVSLGEKRKMIQLGKKQKIKRAVPRARKLRAGDKVQCEYCLEVHTLIPCSDPDDDNLFYSCDGRLRLGVLTGGIAFVTKAKG